MTRSGAALALAVWLVAVPAGAQGIPGSAANAVGAAAWDALDAGRHAEAADLFDGAVALEPHDPSLHLGAGPPRSCWVSPTGPAATSSRPCGCRPRGSSAT